MKKLLFKLNAIRRKNDIDVIRASKESLQRIVLDALAHRYDLNRVQRTEVLKNIVEEWKKQSQELETIKKQEFLEIEEANDQSKKINLFGML